MRPRTVSVAGSLARLGFVDAARAARVLSTPTLAPIADDAVMLQAIGSSPDPDLALLGLLVGKDSDRDGYVLDGPGLDAHEVHVEDERLRLEVLRSGEVIELERTVKSLRQH